MKKALIVNQFYLKKNDEILEKYEVSYAMLFRAIPKFLKPFRFIHQFFRLPMFKIWYTKDFESVFRGYDIIILHDSDKMHANYFIQKITELSDPSTKLIYYYWNSIYHLEHIKMNKRWEIVCFDYKDAIENGLRYVGGYFVPEHLENKEKSIDLFFVGTNKGRFELLQKIEAGLQKLNIKTKFFLVSSKHWFRRNYSSPIPYKEVVDWLSESIGIIELTKQGQIGLTLRAYEAIFYNKKLVTNNSYIKNYDFYHEDKVYILQDSENDVINIATFLKGKEITYSPELVKSYSLESFIERVDQKLALQNVNI